MSNSLQNIPEFKRYCFYCPLKLSISTRSNQHCYLILIHFLLHWSFLIKHLFAVGIQSFWTKSSGAAQTSFVPLVNKFTHSIVKFLKCQRQMQTKWLQSISCFEWRWKSCYPWFPRLSLEECWRFLLRQTDGSHPNHR